LDLRLKKLYLSLCELWKKASTDASRFAPFSFSRTKIPNATLVHNWAYASLIFATMLDEFPQMKIAIESASTNSSLSRGIALAFTTYQTSNQNQSLNDEDLSKIANEDHDSFYSALGRRLVVFQNTKSDALGNALLAQSLHFGPDLADAAVLSIVAGAEFHFDITLMKHLSSYENKIGSESRMLQLTLLPLVELIKRKCHE